MFEFFKRLLEDLNDNLRTDKQKIISSIYNVLTNLDLKYLNFIGELSVLNSLIKSNYGLLQVESPLGNGNTIDYRLIDLNNKKELLVEVVNIHIEKKHTDLPFRINRIVSEKLELKTKSDVNFLKFFLMPVIWCDFEDLQRVKKCFDEGYRIEQKNVIEPCAVLFKHYHFEGRGLDQLIITFGTISTLLKKPTD